MKPLKILIIGPEGVGKTTLRKIFFESDNPLSLLKHSLEPTYGIDINHYDFGTIISVYDLAGQQLNEWLTQSVENFVDSNLILCILDAHSEWKENYRLINQINDIKNQYCSEAIYAIFLHKIDLLMIDDRIDLVQQIQTAKSKIPNVDVILSSITQEFFMELYTNFLSILRKALIKFSDVESKSLILDLNILSILSSNKTYSIEALYQELFESTDLLEKEVKKLQNHQLLVYNPNNRGVQLDEKGKKILNSIKEQVYIKVQQSISSEKEYIQGLLISDPHGRTFYMLEAHPKFFESLTTDKEHNTDPLLISMFFSAIRDFSLTINQQGSSSIQLSGLNFQIISVVYEQIIGIFFIDFEKIELGIKKILVEFIKQIYLSFNQEISLFIDSGKITDSEKIGVMITEKVKDLNTTFQKILLHSKEISRDKILVLYQKLDSTSLQPKDLKELKNLLFHYIVAEDPRILDEIYTLLKMKNLADYL